MPIPAPPPRLSQTPARLAYSDALQQSKSNQDEDVPASAHRDAHTRSRHARADPAASSSPRAAAAQQRLVADIRIIMPSSPFAVSSGGSSPRRTASMDQYPSGSTQAYSPSSPGSPATTRRSDGCASPSSPSKSPLRHTTSANSPSGSGLLSDFRAASQHLLGATATPGRRQALYTACTIGLNAVSIICITFFAVSWYRTYSFNAARTDLITTLRYILLILAPLALWCLPTMCAISALMAWPHSAPTDPAHIPGASPPDDASPISFRIPAKPRSFEAACSDAYATAAASEELLHDIATPRFGFTVHTDPQHDITDGAVVARPRPLTAQDFADACIEGAHRVADSFSSTVSGDHRRPLLPASGKPRGHRGGPGCGGGCCVRTCAIAAVWLRHEVLLGVLCALAGYGTLMLVLFDQNVLTRSTGVAIMTQSPPHLRRLAWSCSTVMFGLYSILLTSDCICAVLSVWCGALLRRHRGRAA